jgi:hypothetical protein
MRRHDWPLEADPAASARHGRDRRPPSGADAAARTPLDMTTATVLDLQQTAGNAAVAAAIGPAVQRQPKPPEKKPAEKKPEEKKAEKKAPEKPQPQWVKDAQARLAQLFPKDPTIGKVVIRDYAGANKELQTIDYGAWTESATEIYLRDPSTVPLTKQKRSKNVAAMVLTYVLKHEAVHVRQFTKDGKPPPTWQRMLEYEKEAYESDRAWLRTKEGESLVPEEAVRDDLDEAADRLVIKIDGLLSATKDLQGKAREDKLYEDMKGAGLIPSGAKREPEELYKQ